ncbi:MAG: M24 family metallopeptidase, partial [Chloroflexi bacterium]|nr:M24 family metallopeptidase [Chloroflexota bacterium]
MSSVKTPNGVTIKSSKELQLMREAGWVVAQAKAKVLEAIESGVSTAELDAIAEEEIKKLGGIPSFKGYTAGGMAPV